MTFEIVPADSSTEALREWYVGEIHSVCRRGFIAVGKLLIDARKRLPHGSFLAMIESDLPFGPRTAQRLMVIAGNEVLSNATYSSHLPGSWTVLYELALVDERLDVPGTLEAWVNKEIVHRGIKGREVEALVEHEERLIAEKREAEKAGGQPDDDDDDDQGLSLPKPYVEFVTYLKELPEDRCSAVLKRLCADVSDLAHGFTLSVSRRGGEEAAARDGRGDQIAEDADAQLAPPQQSQPDRWSETP